jgi:hypothetical protein
MAFTHIWNKLNLHRQKVIILLVLGVLFGSNTVLAQKKITVMNKPGYDDKLVHYGFYLSVPVTRFNIEHSQEYADQLAKGGYALNAKVLPGFYTGLVLDVRVFEYLNARFVPGVGFYGRAVEHSRKVENSEKEEAIVKTVGSTVIELPVLLKYKALRRKNNTRMYLVGGVKPGIDLGSGRSGDNTESELLVKNFDLAVEYGFGVDIFYPFFKFAPEIRFSHGLLNQNVTNESVYNRSIQKLTNHNISFILHFE